MLVYASDTPKNQWKTHSLSVFTTVDLAGPRRESMMRIQGLEQTTLFQQGSAAPYRADRDGVSTHCLQTCLEAAASGVRLSSASVPSSLQSSCRDNTMLTHRSFIAFPHRLEE